MCIHVCYWQWGEIKWCGLTDVFDIVCGARVARSRIVDDLAAYGRSCSCMRHAAECEREEVSVHRGFLFAMEEDAKVRAS